MTQNLRTDFIGQTHQARNREPPLLLDDVDARSRMTARADEQDGFLGQRRSSAPRWALLGRLMTLRSSDSDTGRSIFGHSRYGVR